jgi:hypothetical protein
LQKGIEELSQIPSEALKDKFLEECAIALSQPPPSFPTACTKTQIFVALPFVLSKAHFETLKNKVLS